MMTSVEEQKKTSIQI